MALVEAGSAMVRARKCKGGSSRKENFMMGQFKPHMRVSSTRPMRCWEVKVVIQKIQEAPKWITWGLLFS